MFSLPYEAYHHLPFLFLSFNSWWWCASWFISLTFLGPPRSPFSLLSPLKALNFDSFIWHHYAIHYYFYFFISWTKVIWFDHYQRSSSFISSDRHIWRLFLGYLSMKNRRVFISASARPDVSDPKKHCDFTLEMLFNHCVLSSNCCYMLWFLWFSRHPNAVYAIFDFVILSC